MAKIPSLSQIRLSSLEPGDINEKLLKIMTKNSNIMPHLHLSLQSGSDNILKKLAFDFREKFLSQLNTVLTQIHDNEVIYTKNTSSGMIAKTIDNEISIAV